MWPGPTATGARANTCSPPSTKACAASGWITSISTTTTATIPRRPWRRRWARWPRRALRQSALRRPLQLQPRADRRRRPTAPRVGHTLPHPPTALQHARTHARTRPVPRVAARRRRQHRVLAARQGMLTNRYFAGIPADARAARDPRFLKPAQITPELLATTRQLDALAKARGQSLAQMALAWVLRQPPSPPHSSARARPARSRTTSAR